MSLAIPQSEQPQRAGRRLLGPSSQMGLVEAWGVTEATLSPQDIEAGQLASNRR